MWGVGARRTASKKVLRENKVKVEMTSSGIIEGDHVILSIVTVHVVCVLFQGIRTDGRRPLVSHICAAGDDSDSFHET